MNAKETFFLSFIQGERRLIIPIYQRPYSWTARQCEQLWHDIKRLADHPEVPAHFVGSVVYVAAGLYQISNVPELLVIDGQQRITTITLLLLALSEELKAEPERSELTAEYIRAQYLVNDYQKGERRLKLTLNADDHPTLQALLDGLPLPDRQSHAVLNNYQFFAKKVADPALNIEALFHALRRLLVVDISLDREKDNPQLIFESLNSTGLDLSQADLIRNYVLMGLEPTLQTELYQKLWHPMELIFVKQTQSDLFDRFMRDYLTIKNRQIPNLGDIYVTFKRLVLSSGEPIQTIIENVYRYARNFAALALGAESDPELRDALADLRALKVDVVMPLLLEVYDVYVVGQVSRNDLLATVRIAESYILRRSICDIPTNTLNKTFATLYKELDLSNLPASLEKSLMQRDSVRRFPRDAEFRSILVSRDLYNTRLCDHILFRLENHKRKERVSTVDYTVEHVLPQNPNLSDAWRAELGPNWTEVQDRYLHTIANLTLTGYNSELSDKSFTDKRTRPGGFADSPIRISKSLASTTAWNEAAIRDRAELLADMACECWHCPPEPEASKQISIAPIDISDLFTLDRLANAARHLARLSIEALGGHIQPKPLSVSVREGRTLSIVFGSWVVLQLRQSQDQLDVTIAVDRELLPNDLGPALVYEEPFKLATPHGRTIQLASFVWDGDNLPDELMSAWLASMDFASKTFAGWTASISAGKHSPELVASIMASQEFETAEALGG